MLSVAGIKAAKPRPRDQWLSDGAGLYLRVRASGGKSWVLRRKRKQPDGTHKTKVITLGKWPDMGLKEARVAATKTRGTAVPDIKLGELLEKWYAEVIEPTYKRPRQVEQYIGRVSDELYMTKLRDLNRLAVREFLLVYADERGPVAANRLLSILKQATAFAIQAGYTESSPIEGLPRRIVGGQEKPRQRVLSDSEIKALWSADSPHTPLLRFLLLTGQRIRETQLARWEDIEGDRWSIPAENTKPNRGHWVPLSTQAAAIIEAQDKDRSLIFGKVTESTPCS